MKSCEQYSVKIYMAGDFDSAVEVCSLFCDERPNCVNLSRTTYIYTGGVEDGVCVEFINYARFPRDESKTTIEAALLASRLRNKLGQRSYSIITPNESHYFTCEKELT